MIALWPLSSRGTEATVPIPPGLVRRDVGALEVVGGELVLARLRDQLFVVGVEAGEVEPVGALDRRHHQAVGAVLLLDVDGDPEVDRAVLDRERLAVALLEDPHHHREVFGRLDDRPGDEVGEGDLQPALFEHRVDRLPLRVERVDRDRPERGRRRHRPALVHRLGQHRRGPPQLLRLAGGSGSAAPLPPPSPAASTSSLVTFAPGPIPLTEAKIDAVRFGNPPRDGRRAHIGAAVARAVAPPGRCRRSPAGGAEEGPRPQLARTRRLLGDRTRGCRAGPSPDPSPASISASGAPTGTSSSTAATVS